MKKLLILLPILLTSCMYTGEKNQDTLPKESTLIQTGASPRTVTEVQVDTSSVQILSGSVTHTIQ